MIGLLAFGFGMLAVGVIIGYALGWATGPRLSAWQEVRDALAGGFKITNEAGTAHFLPVGDGVAHETHSRFPCPCSPTVDGFGAVIHHRGVRA